MDHNPKSGITTKLGSTDNSTREQLAVAMLDMCLMLLPHVFHDKKGMFGMYACVTMFSVNSINDQYPSTCAS